MYYGDKHPMKPIRIAMAHDLIVGYKLYQVIIVNFMRSSEDIWEISENGCIPTSQSNSVWFEEIP